MSLQNEGITQTLISVVLFFISNYNQIHFIYSSILTRIKENLFMKNTDLKQPRKKIYMTNKIIFLFFSFLVISLQAEEFLVNQSRTDRLSGVTLKQDQLSFSKTTCMRVWHLEFVKPGFYQVDLNVSVDSAHAGSVARVGEWLSPEGMGDSILIPLPATGSASKWIKGGKIYVQDKGLRFIFIKAEKIAHEEMGNIKAIRITGPGKVVKGEDFGVVTSALDIQANNYGKYRTAKYVESIACSWPIPETRGMARTALITGDYAKVMGTIGFSVWNSNLGPPKPVVAYNGADFFSNEGSGAGIKRYDFYVPTHLRRRVYITCVPTGDKKTITSVCGAGYGEPWHLAGRILETKSRSLNRGGVGFLENPSMDNTVYYRKQFDMGNVWSFYPKEKKWSPNPEMSASWRKGDRAYGRSFMRKDMLEVLTGGNMRRKTYREKHTFTPPKKQPNMPSLNLLCELKDKNKIYLFPDAIAGRKYNGDLFKKIRDPFSSLRFEYTKTQGQSWLKVNPEGTLSGIPNATMSGLQLFTIKIFDKKMGLYGMCTAGIFVKNPHKPNPSVFLDFPRDVKTAQTKDDPEIVKISMHDPIPTHSPKLQITAGNDKNFFSVQRKGNDFMLIKTGKRPELGDYTLKLTLSDPDAPTAKQTTTVVVHVVPQGHGVSIDQWFLCWDQNTRDINELLKDPRFPNTPNWSGTRTDCKTKGGGCNGEQLSGYLYPPETGKYTFWPTIRRRGKKTAVQLYLSTDESKKNLKLIKPGSSISLQKGQRYLLISFSWDGVASIEWKGPGIPKRQLITNAYVTPYKYRQPHFITQTISLLPALTGAPYNGYLRHWFKGNDLAFYQDITYSKLSGPEWLKVDPTHPEDVVLKGSPSEKDAGENLFKIRAMAPGGLYQDITLKIKVIRNTPPQAAAPIIVYPAITLGDEIKDQYFLTKQIRDANDPGKLGVGDRLEYSILAGPKWLHVSPIGRLYGNPSADYVGLNRFKLHVVDTAGAAIDVPLHVTVKPGNLKPYFVEDPMIKGARVGHPFAISLAQDCISLNKNDPISFKKIEGPSWLRIARNGKFLGRPPSKPGRYSFKIKGTNSRGLSVTATLFLDVFSNKLYIYEGFDGPEGKKVAGSTGGTDWNGAWEGKNKRRFASPGLSFPGLRVQGNKCDNDPRDHGRTNNELKRLLAQRLTIGKNSAAGEHPEIWMSALFEINPKIRRRFASRAFSRIRLFGKEGFIGAFGKVDGILDFMGCNFPPVQLKVSKKLSSKKPTLIFMIVRLSAGAQPNTTKITTYTLEPNQLKGKVSLLNPESFPNKKSFILHRKLTIDYLIVSRNWDELGFIDEIRISNTYKGVLGK